MACRLAALTFTPPFRRHLLMQLLPRYCRYCCHPHKQIHTSRLIFQEDRKKLSAAQTIRVEKDKNINKGPGAHSRTLSDRLKQPLEGTHSLTIPFFTYRALILRGGKDSEKLNYKVMGNRTEIIITGSKEALMEFQDVITLKLNGLFQFTLPLNDFQCMKVEIGSLMRKHEFQYSKHDGKICIFKKSLKSCEQLVETMKNVMENKGIECPDNIEIERLIPDKFGITENTHQKDRIEALKSKLQDKKPISQQVVKTDSSKARPPATVHNTSSTNSMADVDAKILDGSARILLAFKFVLEKKKEELQEKYGVQITLKGTWKNERERIAGTFLSVSGPEDNVKKCKQSLKEMHDSTFRILLVTELKQHLFDKKHLPKSSLEDQHNVQVHEFHMKNMLVIGSKENVKSFYNDLKTHIEEARKIPELKNMSIGKGPKKEFKDPLVFDVTEKDVTDKYNKSGIMNKGQTGTPDGKSRETKKNESRKDNHNQGFDYASKDDKHRLEHGEKRFSQKTQRLEHSKEKLKHGKQELQSDKDRLEHSEQRLKTENKTQRLENVGKIVNEAKQLTMAEDAEVKSGIEDVPSVVEPKVKGEAPKTKEKKMPKTEVISETQKSDQDNVEKQTNKPKPVPVLKSRPPVVTIMGHVDHGKTTLLDAFRKSNVVSQEFGGITQHIGAFQVKLKSGNIITFLDTPGHAAFTNMRSRGASMTDIIVLVVAAEDGIMNQTVESIKHAKKAKVPVIVAINKIDLPSAEPEKVKYELANHGIVGEDLGGDVQIVLISALKGTNLDELQENIIAQSEMLDLKADNKCMVKATVIESKVDIGRGIQATALIQKGTLKRGSYVIAGTSCAKVRAMLNEHGKPITEAPPGTPVVVTGWDSVPSAGEQVMQVENEGKMKAILAQKEKEAKEELMEASVHQINERRQQLREDYEMMRDKKKQLHWKQYTAILRERKGDKVDDGMLKFPVILKADVDGSLEVIMETLNTFYSDHMEMSIVSAEVGNINEGDFELAKSTGGRIYGFNVKENEDLSRKYNVPVTVKNVIYDLFNSIQEDIEEDLPTTDVEKEIGRAEVLALFEVTDKDGDKTNVAGCKCVSGILRKDCMYRVLRGEETLYEGPLVSMRRLKKDVNSITEGTECGLGLDGTVDVREGDQVICMEKYSEKMELEWDHGVHHIAR